MRGAKRAELLNAVSNKLGEDVKSSVVDQMVDAIAESIRELVKQHGAVSLNGLGRFYMRKTKARKGRNPKTGASVQVKAGEKISFKATKQ